MSTITNNTFFKEADSSERNLRYINDGATPGTGGSPTIANITTFNPSGGSGGADEFGTTIASGTFKGRNFIIETESLRQEHSATLDIQDCTFNFVNGWNNLGGTNSPMGTGAITVDWELDGCTFLATRASGSTATGWGSVDAASTVRGFHRNCRWVGTRNGSDDGWATWFVNFSRTDAGFELTNPEFVLSVLNTAQAGWWIVNGSFDGTIRPGGNSYTVRLIALSGSNVLSSFAQIDFANHASSDFGYETANGSAISQTEGVHFQNFLTPGDTYWMMNNRYESSSIALASRGNAGGRVREGYSWRPRFRVTGTTTDITDVRLVGLVAGSDPATFTSGGASQAMFTLPTTVSPTTDYTRVSGTAGLVSTVAPNGLYIQVSTTADTTGTSQLLDKALDWSTDANTYTVASGNTHTLHAKSYSHLVDNSMTTECNRISYSGGNAGTITFDEFHDISAGADENLNSRAENATQIAAATSLSTLDDWYPAEKRLWRLDDTEESNPVSHSGVAVTFSRNTTVDGTRTADSSYGASEILLKSTASPSMTNTTEVVAGANTTVTLTNLTFPANLTLTASDTGASMALTGASFGNNNTLSGSFTGVDNAGINGESLNVAGGSTIELASVGAATTVDWEDISVTGTGNVTINRAGSNAITVRVPSSLTSRFTGGTGVTIAAVPVTFTRTYRVPSKAGKFIVRQTGLASSAANTVERTITTSSSVANRSWEILSTDTNSYHLYWKPDSSATTDEGYEITHIGPVTGTDVTATGTVDVSNTTIAAVLYEFDTTNTINFSWAANTADKGPSSDTDKYQARTLSLGGATGSTVDGGTTLAGLLQAANDIRYLQTVAVNYITGADANIITPGGTGVSEVDSRYVTLASENAQQQLVQGITFLDPLSESLSTSTTASLTANTVSVSPNPDGITIGEVRTATNEALDTNQRLQDAENQMAYIVSDGDSSSPSVTSSRLVGLKPKNADYNPSTDYSVIND